MPLKTIAETKNYVAVKVPGGNVGHESWEDAIEYQLKNMEALLTQGFSPLHYLPAQSAW